MALAARRVTGVVAEHLDAPFDLALERLGANTILLIRHGVPIYSPETYDAPPGRSIPRDDVEGSRSD